jgi:hypothetical protein
VLCRPGEREEVAPVQFNYRDAGELAAAGFDWILSFQA